MKQKKQKKNKGHANYQKQSAAAAGGALYTCPYCAGRFTNKGQFTSHVGTQCDRRYDAMATVMPMDVDTSSEAPPPLANVLPRSNGPPRSNASSRSLTNAPHRNLEVPHRPPMIAMAMPMDTDCSREVERVLPKRSARHIDANPVNNSSDNEDELVFD